MKEFTEYLMAKGYSSKTAKNTIKAVMNFTVWLAQQHIEESTITYNDFTAYIKTTQQRSIKTRSVQIIANHIKHYLDYLVDAGILFQNPALALKIKNAKRKMVYNILSPEELETIYKSYRSELPKKEESLPLSGERKGGYPPQTKNILARKRNKIALGIFIYQGITSEDLANIELNHLELREGKITIPGARRINERTLKLEPFQIFDLYDYVNEARKQILQITGKQNNRLFISIGSSNEIQNTLQKFIKELIEQNPNLENLHQIRASVISYWLKQYNKRKVQYMAGHRYISSTERYEASNIEELQDDIEKYYPVL